MKDLVKICQPHFQAVSYPNGTIFNSSIATPVWLIMYNFHPLLSDNVDYNATNGSKPPLPFSMSGDSDANVRIPSVFMQRQDAETLRELLREEEKVQVLLTWIPRYPDEEATTGNSSHDGEEESGHIGQSDNSQTESEVYKDKACAGEGRGTEQDARQCDSDQEHSSVGSNSLFDSGYSEPELESERENT